MTIDAQEYLQEWEKINNPFYPNEMKWDRLTVNKFLCDYKRQLPIASHAVLSDVGELLPCPFCGSTNIKYFGVHGDNMYCRCCGAEGSAGDGTLDSAKSKWNKRANVR